MFTFYISLFLLYFCQSYCMSELDPLSFFYSSLSLAFFRGLWLLRGPQASVQEAGGQHLPRRPRGEKLKQHFLFVCISLSSVSLCVSF